MKFIKQEKPKLLRPSKEALLVEGDMSWGMSIIEFLNDMNYSVTVVNALERAVVEMKKRSFNLCVSDDKYPLKWGGNEYEGVCFKFLEAATEIRGKRINFVVFSNEQDIAKACAKLSIPHFKKDREGRAEFKKYLESI